MCNHELACFKVSGRKIVYRQLSREPEAIKADSPCIGVCTLNEVSVCVGCNRHIDEIVKAGHAEDKHHNIP